MPIRRMSVLQEYQRRGYLSPTHATVGRAYAVDLRLAGEQGFSKPDMVNLCRRMRAGVRTECIVAKERIASAHKILPPSAAALLLAVARDVPPSTWIAEHGGSPHTGIKLLRQALDEIAPIYLEA
jgi:hypothetical protein